ncbi:hypothetical protein HRW23_23520 [Streptomyces lunaelactis]|uniref:hypothetical protein n=1 Tax=Streptomyces lunaelactis TaxID=1535768 RepID=UPI001584C30D|nr:hypothetical protein [Streptomyces lunaelactis]NUJ99768.1 hypothetical protein [Streptomyces lunaelactis]NUK09563.1 hypothetical protein [Streptomyces lunaelactis]NUK13964.1 hypothetical protein [Streptomyces lunaelactis]NUK26937.1 hypothetical protein [Streptomyces lunaelactis]NUK35685.1 hypothetical protein [Streptomyces lunaelactis]
MAGLPNGRYRIAFTNEQFLTAVEQGPGAPLMLLPPGSGLSEEWEVRGNGNGTHTVRIPDVDAYVSFDGEPDMHEPALILPESREWRLIPGMEPGTYFIGVTDAPMRLGLSLLRIYPPRVALAPEYGDPYQAWTFQRVD